MIEQLDLEAALKISAAFASPASAPALIKRLLLLAVEYSAADRAVYCSITDGAWTAVAEARRGDDIIEFHGHGAAGAQTAGLDTLIVDEAVRTGAAIAIVDRSALLLVAGHTPIGVLYLEVRSGAGPSAPSRSPTLTFIAAQAAAALEGAARLEALQGALATVNRSEEAIRQTVAAIPAVIAITKANGAVEFTSPVWTDYTGQEQSQSRGLGWLDAVHPADRPSMATRWEKLIKAEKMSEYEVRVLGRDGAYRWFLFNSRPYRDETGRVVNWYGTAVDIDEKKRAQASLDELQVKLANVARIASLGELTASIAHEINQPLAAVLANADTGLRWLSHAPPNLTETRAVLERIQKNAVRMDAVIVRLRQMFTNGPRRREIFDLNEALAEVLVFMRAEAIRQGVLIRSQVADAPLRIDGDRIQIQQVVLNLITNAIQAIGPALVRKVEISSAGASGRVTVEIQDSGPGFRGEDPETLFESFKTTKAEGMGLGLSISRSIIEDHDGRIWGEPNGAVGAVFRFELPLIG